MADDNIMYEKNYVILLDTVNEKFKNKNILNI